jgi:hypothetical protein
MLEDIADVYAGRAQSITRPGQYKIHRDGNDLVVRLMSQFKEGREVV